MVFPQIKRYVGVLVDSMDGFIRGVVSRGATKNASNSIARSRREQPSIARPSLRFFLLVRGNANAKKSNVSKIFISLVDLRV
jgi:hypothetical protein